jgi:hypothetical protein
MFNFYYCPKNGFCWMQSSRCESYEWRKTVIMNPCLWTHVMSKQEVNHLLLTLLMGMVSNLTSADTCILYDSDWMILLILHAYHSFTKMSVIERFNSCSSCYSHVSFNYLNCYNIGQHAKIDCFQRMGTQVWCVIFLISVSYYAGLVVLGTTLCIAVPRWDYSFLFFASKMFAMNLHWCFINSNSVVWLLPLWNLNNTGCMYALN